MSALKKIFLVASFALLVACDGGSDKFVGQWIEANPKEEKIIYGRNVNEPQKIIIKANGSNEVELEWDYFGAKKKTIYQVDGENIRNGSRVIYTLKGEELVTTDGLAFIRK